MERRFIRRLDPHLTLDNNTITFVPEVSDIMMVIAVVAQDDGSHIKLDPHGDRRAGSLDSPSDVPLT